MRHLIVLVLLAATAASVAAQPVTPGSRLDGVAAVVNDQIVLYSEVDALAQQAAASQQAAVTPDLWSRALDQLVDRRILIANARLDTTVVVTDDQVSQQLDGTMAQLIQSTGSEAALEAAYGRSLEEIRESLREDTHDDIALQIYRGKRMRAVSVTPNEVREWFALIPEAERPMVPELVRVAHVVRVPAPSEASRAQARAFTQALRDSILAEQATIEELANRHSQDPGNVNRSGTRNGGRYDGFSLRDLVPEFSAAAAALEAGQFSQVFETSFGYHVMRLNERRGDNISFNHILIPVASTGAEVEEARATLSVLRDSILTHNVPIEAIARRHSEDPYSAARGGFVSDPRTGERDLQLDALGPLWKATVEGLDVGELSEPREVNLLDGSTAYHIALLQRRTPTHRLSIADDYALLSDYALQQKQQSVLYEWVESLRRTTYVDIRADRYIPRSQS
jgi:peptidyl-prolyl cis-trans isomerase SurA